MTFSHRNDTKCLMISSLRDCAIRIISIFYHHFFPSGMQLRYFGAVALYFYGTRLGKTNFHVLLQQTSFPTFAGTMF